jgi:hypothetical protein
MANARCRAPRTGRMTHMLGRVWRFDRPKWERGCFRFLGASAIALVPSVSTWRNAEFKTPRECPSISVIRRAISVIRRADSGSVLAQEPALSGSSSLRQPRRGRAPTPSGWVVGRSTGTTNGLTRHLLRGSGLSSRVLNVAGSSGYLGDPWWLLRREGRPEEVDEQLCDALSLVVMDPMRRLR